MFANFHEKFNCSSLTEKKTNLTDTLSFDTMLSHRGANKIAAVKM